MCVCVRERATFVCLFALVCKVSSDFLFKC